MQIFIKIITFPVGEKDSNEQEYLSRADNFFEGRILCIGYSFGTKKTETLVGDEESVMKAFNEALVKEPIEDRQNITWTGFGLLEKEIPWLKQRAMKYGCKTLLEGIITNGRAIDLRKEFLHPYRYDPSKDNITLGDVCNFTGYEYTDHATSKIVEMAESGKQNYIGEHCRAGVLAIKHLFRKLPVNIDLHG